MQRIAVIIYGAPGSGKSTQAALVAKKHGLIFFDTGKYIASVIYDPKYKKDKVVQRQKKLYEGGLLCDRPWVFKIVSAQIKKIIASGYGIILAGSPRGDYETFGDKGRPGVYAILEKGYGKKNIHTFLLTVSEKDTHFRNSRRKVCPTCGLSFMHQKGKGLRNCPFCATPLKTRKDDAASIIAERIREYKKSTQPTFAKLRKMGYALHRINGILPPYKVFRAIQKWLP